MEVTQTIMQGLISTCETTKLLSRYEELLRQLALRSQSPHCIGTMLGMWKIRGADNVKTGAGFVRVKVAKRANRGRLLFKHEA